MEQAIRPAKGEYIDDAIQPVLREERIDPPDVLHCLQQELELHLPPATKFPGKPAEFRQEVFDPVRFDQVPVFFGILLFSEVCRIV